MKHAIVTQKMRWVRLPLENEKDYLVSADSLLKDYKLKTRLFGISRV